MHFEQVLGDALISTDPSKLDLDVIHGFLKGCYWAEGIPREVVAKSLLHSLCFGAYVGGRQVGFARAITDRATYAYVGDVFVLESHRGKGLSKLLMAAMMAHPDLQDLRRWSLLTRDAHDLYGQFGFTPLAAPGRYMEISVPDIYKRKP